MIEQYLPHYSRCYGEEVHFIMERPVSNAIKFEIRFVHQSGRLERVVTPLIPHVPVGDPTQLVV